MWKSELRKNINKIHWKTKGKTKKRRTLGKNKVNKENWPIPTGEREREREIDWAKEKTMKGCSCKEREREKYWETVGGNDETATWINLFNCFEGEERGEQGQSIFNRNFCQKQIRVKLFVFTLLKIFPVEFQYFNFFSSIDYCVFLFFAFHKID